MGGLLWWVLRVLWACYGRSFDCGVFFVFLCFCLLVCVLSFLFLLRYVVYYRAPYPHCRVQGPRCLPGQLCT